ncbi:MAG: DUF6528 family protein [Aureliella sp.]
MHSRQLRAGGNVSHCKSCRWIVIWSMWLLCSSASAGEQIICCGAERVFILELSESLREASEPKPVWTWTAEDSEAIPKSARSTFASTDECKPYVDSILITSSSGGVALIRREDKVCEFFTTAKNAHSACLLPNSMVAVASSFGGDELLLYKLMPPAGKAAEPIAKIPLHGAHGVVWDVRRKCLWALGSDELLCLEMKVENDKAQLEVQTRLALPKPGGHELSQTSDPDWMIVSTDNHVYAFNIELVRFMPFKELANAAKVKSVSTHPMTGEVVYHQGAKTTWWSDRIRFLGERESIQLPGERLYKIRWDVPVFRWKNLR